MPLPLIPVILIGTGVVTGAGGAALGLKGGLDVKRANSRIRAAGVLYADARAVLEAEERATNERLRSLGDRQETSIHAVVDRMADFLRRHQKQVSASEKLLLDGLDGNLGRVSIDESLGLNAVSWMRGVVGSAVTGVGLNAGITAGVTTFAAASTGTAISGLSGAAATNATLAFLGGGSLATGGGGMAVGAAALNFVTIGPAILVSGLVVAGQGQKAKTRARENEALVNVAIAEAQAQMVQFAAIVARADEIEGLLDQLVERATRALDLLESMRFDPSCHATRFQEALILATAVRDVAVTQIVDDCGDLNEATELIRLKYRALTKETENG